MSYWYTSADLYDVDCANAEMRAWFKRFDERHRRADAERHAARRNRLLDLRK